MSSIPFDLQPLGHGACYAVSLATRSRVRLRRGARAMGVALSAPATTTILYELPIFSVMRLESVPEAYYCAPRIRSLWTLQFNLVE